MLRNTSLLWLIIIMVFLFAGCGAVAGETAGSAGIAAAPGSTDKVDGISVDTSTAVITEAVVDIFAGPDIKSERISQAIYNQPAEILEEKNGWARISAVDGSIGWVRAKFIDRIISSIYGRAYSHKIIVTSKDKSIFSAPAGGITIKDVTMGTELYAFNTSGNAYEVYLPGNTTGWLRGSGLIHVDLNAATPVTSSKDFVSSALKFKGTSYLLNGMSSMGVDSPGMIYICSRINGINMPRDLKKQMQFGDKTALDEIAAGDIVFIASEEDEDIITDAGICLGNGQYIHASRSSGYVRLDGLNESGSDGKPVFARRTFR